MKRGHSKYGFTIVELLIVIVVIGILAAISVTAFNGIKERAYNTQVAVSINAYLKALVIYKEVKGDYPAHASSVCLGRDYIGGTCWWGTPTVNESAAFMTDLESVVGASNLPGPTPTGTTTGSIYTPVTHGNQLDGINRAFIAYTVRGSTSRCPVGPVVTFNSGQSFSSAAPANGQTVVQNGFFLPQCWIALP